MVKTTNQYIYIYINIIQILNIRDAGGASVTISGFHPEHITAVSLCGTRCQSDRAFENPQNWRVFAAVQSWDMDGYGILIYIYILMGYFNGV